jgi:hypothetical protein
MIKKIKNIILMFCLILSLTCFSNKPVLASTQDGEIVEQSSWISFLRLDFLIELLSSDDGPTDDGPIVIDENS